MHFGLQCDSSGNYAGFRAPPFSLGEARLAEACGGFGRCVMIHILVMIFFLIPRQVNLRKPEASASPTEFIFFPFFSNPIYSAPGLHGVLDLSSPFREGPLYFFLRCAEKTQLY